MLVYATNLKIVLTIKQGQVFVLFHGSVKTLPVALVFRHLRALL